MLIGKNFVFPCLSLYNSLSPTRAGYLHVHILFSKFHARFAFAMYKLIWICGTCCKFHSACVTGSSPCSTHWVMRSRARLLVWVVMADTLTSRLLRSSSRWQLPMESRRHALQCHCILLITELVSTCFLLRSTPKSMNCTFANGS